MFNIFNALKKKTYNNKNNVSDLNKLVKIPTHIAIIMDGNGRWATKRNLPRTKGHYFGMQNIKKITKYASKIGVKYLTLYAFSTENWSRPKNEVNYLMNLPEKMFSSFMPEIIKNNIKISVIGDIKKLPINTQNVVENAINKTKNNKGLNLILALNYGARKEIENALINILSDLNDKKITNDEINENLISKYMSTNLYPDPDLLIRTSGEKRLSNFLLWQIAYSELIFEDIEWPDFDENILYKCLLEYQKRDRRFGGLNES